MPISTAQFNSWQCASNKTFSLILINKSGEQEIKSDDPDNGSDYGMKDKYTGRGCEDDSDIKEADTNDIGDRGDSDDDVGDDSDIKEADTDDIGDSGGSDDDVGEGKHDLKESNLVLLYL